MSNNPNYKSKIQFKQQICDKPHIYKITNLIDNKYYYGVHDGSDTENYEGSGKLLKQAYKKYGKENFLKEILMWFDTEEEAYEYEEVVVNEKMINKNNPMCYNLVIGGKGGDKYSDLTPERQAEINQKKSEKTKGKNPHIDKTDEQRKVINQKISDTLKNKTQEEREETKKKLNITLSNKTQEEKEEAKRKSKITLSNKTQEEKENEHKNRSKAQLGKKRTQVIKNRLSKLLKDTIKITNGDITKQVKKDDFENIWKPLGWYQGLSKNTKKRGKLQKQLQKYHCPYNLSIQRDGGNMAQYIKKNYSNEKQWNEFTIEEKEKFKVL